MQKMLNKKEVAELLGVSVYTIDKWVSGRKNIPFSKFGSRVLFQENDVLEYVMRVRLDTFDG